MKTKITLLFTQYSRQLCMTDFNHINIFFTDNLKFTSCYLGSKYPEEALENIYAEHFRTDHSWFCPQLSGFRKTNLSECEVVYSSSRPLIPNINKTGQFNNMFDVLSQKIEIEPYYEQLLRLNNFIII